MVIMVAVLLVAAATVVVLVVAIVVAGREQVIFPISLKVSVYFDPRFSPVNEALLLYLVYC